jgi:hypothetical protein
MVVADRDFDPEQLSSTLSLFHEIFVFERVAFHVRL